MKRTNGYEGRGGSGGGGGEVLGVRTLPFWGTPKLYKEGKTCARTNATF